MKVLRQVTTGLLGGVAVLLGAVALTAGLAGDPVASTDGRTWSAPAISDGAHWGSHPQRVELADGSQWGLRSDQT